MLKLRSLFLLCAMLFTVEASFAQTKSTSKKDVCAGNKKCEKYEKASPFKHGVAIVKKKYKYGYVDKNWNKITSTKYGKASNFDDNGFASVAIWKKRDGYKYGLINREGKTVIPTKHLSPLQINGNFIFAEGENGYGYYDTKGKVIIPLKHTVLGPIKNDRAYFGNGKELGFLDGAGKIVVPIQFKRLTSFSENFAGVQFGQAWKFIDINGTPVFDRSFEQVGIFANGIVRVKISGQWALINKDGKTIVNLPYEHVWPYKNNLYKVKRGDSVGFINQKGVEIIPPIYDYISQLHVATKSNDFLMNEGIEDTIVAKKNGRWSILNHNGKQVIAPAYIDFDARGFIDGQIMAKREDDLWVMLDRSGNDMEADPDTPPQRTMEMMLTPMILAPHPRSKK